jgi:hypothetical protein
MPLRSGPTPPGTAATCGNSGEANVVRAEHPSNQSSAQGGDGTRKLRYQHAISCPFRLPRTSTTWHPNTEHPGVTQMRRFRNHADRCQTPSGRLRQCRLS